MFWFEPKKLKQKFFLLKVTGNPSTKILNYAYGRMNKFSLIFREQYHLIFTLLHNFTKGYNISGCVYDFPQDSVLMYLEFFIRQLPAKFRVGQKYVIVGRLGRINSLYRTDHCDIPALHFLQFENVLQSTYLRLWVTSSFAAKCLTFLSMILRREYCFS